MSEPTTELVRMRYYISLVGTGVGYYANVRMGESHRYRCTEDWGASDNGEYRPMLMREFNCPYILTELSPVKELKVRVK